MAALFARLRGQSFGTKALMLFVYGLATFVGIYLVGNVVLNNPVFFRVFEFLWFIHLVIIVGRLQQSQREYLVLALIALSPGILNNIRDALFLG